MKMSVLALSFLLVAGCTNSVRVDETCDEGYSYDGTACVADNDPCLNNNGGCGDPLFVDCFNNVGASPGCIDIDECEIETDDCTGSQTCHNDHATGWTCVDDNVLMVTTTSTSATWSPTLVINTGETLRWEVSGGVTHAERTVDVPSFDLSANTGTATIMIRSTSGFAGLTELGFDELDITSTAIVNATDLTVFSCKLNPDYWSVDISTLTKLVNVTIRNNSLSTVDTSNNVALESLFAYNNLITAVDLSANEALIRVHLYNNQLPTAQLDQMVIDLDTNAQSDGTLRIADNPGVLSLVADVACQSLVAKNWTIDVPCPSSDVDECAGEGSGNDCDINATCTDTPDSFSCTCNTGYCGDGTYCSADCDALEHPRLTNFRIDNSTPDRIWFDSSEAIVGTSTKGFTVRGKTLSDVSINTGGTDGHYFTVSEPFTFWDNHAIRYEGMAEGNESDIEDLTGNRLFDFTLTHILNHITIAEGAEKVIFVDINAPVGGDGTSEATAFNTLQDGINAMVTGGGNKIWVKAGQSPSDVYTEGSISGIREKSSPDATKPNVIEGYKTSISGEPVPISENYFDFVVGSGGLPTAQVFDPQEMPLFDGNSRDGLYFWSFGGSNYSYWTWKNIQVQEYKAAYRVQNQEGTYLYNVNIKDLGDSVGRGSGVGFAFTGGNGVSNPTNMSNKVRIRGCNVINASMDGILIYGHHALIEDTNVYCNEFDPANNDGLTTDYYIAIKGSDSIIKNCIVHRDTEKNKNAHAGHGISLKTAQHDPPLKDQVLYNLIQGCTAVNIGAALETRHKHAQYNVFKNNEAHADVHNRRDPNDAWVNSGGIYMSDGGSYNLWERNHVHHVDAAINFEQTSGEHDPEDGYASIQHHSTFRNNLIEEVRCVIRGNNVHAGTTSTQSHNALHNNTIHNALWMYSIKDNEPFVFDTTNELQNNILSGVASMWQPDGVTTNEWTYGHTCSWDIWTDNGVAPAGASNVSVDPLFVSSTDLHLQEDSPIRDSGADMSTYHYGYDGMERLPGAYSIGAYER